jgi:hypothetical protein
MDFYGLGNPFLGELEKPHHAVVFFLHIYRSHLSSGCVSLSSLDEPRPAFLGTFILGISSPRMTSGLASSAWPRQADSVQRER